MFIEVKNQKKCLNIPKSHKMSNARGPVAGALLPLMQNEVKFNFFIVSVSTASSFYQLKLVVFGAVD